MMRIAALLGALTITACQSAATQYDAAEDVRGLHHGRARERPRRPSSATWTGPALRASCCPQAKAAIAAKAGPLGAMLGERLDESTSIG
jgi:hypothetical protein